MTYDDIYFIKFVEVMSEAFTHSNIILRIGLNVIDPIQNPFCAELSIFDKDFVKYSCVDGVARARALFFLRMHYGLRLYEVKILALRL